MYTQAAYKKSIKKFYQKKISDAANAQVFNNTFKPASFSNIMPCEIISTEWTNWNNQDIIVYKSASGRVYLLQDENLLSDINKFMHINCINSRLPYIHVEGKETRECFRQPENIHIIEYLRIHLHKYNIYTNEGELVRGEINETANRNELTIHL